MGEKQEQIANEYFFRGVLTGGLIVFIYWNQYSTNGFETWFWGLTSPMWSIILSLPLVWIGVAWCSKHFVHFVMHLKSQISGN